MGFFSKIFKGIKTGLSGIVKEVRDPLQTLAVLAGNVVLPGSSIVTSRLVSQGAQKNLNSSLGRLAQLGTGGFGAAQGNLANFGNIGRSISGAFGGALGGSAGGAGSGFSINQGLTNSLFQGAPSGAASVFSSLPDLPHINLPGPSGVNAGSVFSDGFSWNNWAKSLANPSSLLSLGSGLSGLGQASDLAQLAQQAQQNSSPFDTSGSRALANQQIQDFLRDPTQAAQNDPGYRFRIQAAERATAPYGQSSGAAAVAAADASSSFFNDRLAQLGRLAGADFNPGTGNELLLRGTNDANALRSSALGSIGYGLTPGSNDYLQNLLRILAQQAGGQVNA